MIRVDLRSFVRDRMWFGWNHGVNWNVDTIWPEPNTDWQYSMWWCHRLWPVKRLSSNLPNWWLDMTKILDSNR